MEPQPPAEPRATVTARAASNSSELAQLSGTNDGNGSMRMERVASSDPYDDEDYFTVAFEQVLHGHARNPPILIRLADSS